MKKIISLLKDFLKNVKNYVDYLMKVDFKELFINVLILICILVLAAFVYIPIGIVQDFIWRFIIIFVSISPSVSLFYNWVFYVIGFIVGFIAFVYLFNKRFEDIEELKKQIRESHDDTIVEKEVPNDDLDLPKELPKSKKNK